MYFDAAVINKTIQSARASTRSAIAPPPLILYAAAACKGKLIILARSWPLPRRPMRDMPAVNEAPSLVEVERTCWRALSVLESSGDAAVAPAIVP
ncbi:hypothetical protein RJ55_02853 [Drechmeria coniospora]|nr:hypothetical protein RJ55_02853 [Drechmeria coniospora]